MASYCNDVAIDCYRGSLNNVLERFLGVLKINPDYDYLVRVTGDCPLIYPAFIDRQIQLLMTIVRTWCV